MLTSTKSKSKRYLRISDGAFTEIGKDSKKSRFYAVSGQLTGIVLREHKHGDRNFQLWHVIIEDAEETYDISFSIRCSTFRSIVRFLSSQRGLVSLGDNIKIQVWDKNGYTNACVWAGGEKLDWLTDIMPGVQTVHIDGREIKDDTDRMAWISKLVSRINFRLSENSMHNSNKTTCTTTHNIGGEE